MRHMSQEAIKRMRTGSNFGVIPPPVVGPAPRPRHSTSFPPFLFSNPRFDRSMSQNGTSIESLFTLPSENPNGSRVKRSLSDNRIQMESSSRGSLTQRLPNSNEMEGVYTLSSMDMLPVTNMAKPNSSSPNSSRSDKTPQTDINSTNPNSPNPNSSNPYSRFRSLLRSRSQMEGALNMSPMDKRLFLETALANTPNANANAPNANAKANEIDNNKNEAMPSVSSMEKSTDVCTVNPDTNENEENRTLLKNQSKKENPNSNENEMEAVLSLSSNRSSDKNPNSIGIELSLSSVERSHTTKGVVNKSLPQSCGEMEGVLSLSSMERLTDTSNATKPDSRIEMASILTLASVEDSTHRNSENPNTNRGEKSLATEKNSHELNSTENHGQMEGVSNQGQRERSTESNLMEPNPSQMESTSVSSIKRLPNANSLRHHQILLVYVSSYSFLKDMTLK